MEPCKTGADSRLIWVCLTPEKSEPEERILQALQASNPIVLRSDEDLNSFAFEPGDLIVFNSNGLHARATQIIEQIHPGIPNLRILVRCSLSERPWDLIARFESIGLLDADEGPDLTRARLARASADRRIIRREPVGDTPVPEWRKKLIGNSPVIQKIAETIRLVGPRRCNVLITGETGTGKEIAARAIHLAGSRAAKPFVAVNCSAIPAALLESELFGHTRGAFTGAVQARVGRFEQADGGTLFLDEIGDLPLELQAKLLRVLQEREFQRLGSSESVRTDVRVIAATHCDLQAKVAEGSFREDLYYRLNVVPLALPPLRMRGSDIRLLAEHFLRKICQDENLPEKRITSETLSALELYDWPGNIRQLENAISSAAVLSEEKQYLDEDDFALHVTLTPMSAPVLTEMPTHGINFTKTIMDLERNLVSQALTKTRGNKKAAAEMLQLKRTTLSAKIRVLDLARVVA